MLYRVHPDQSIMDIAVQFTGEAGRLFELLDVNPGYEHYTTLFGGEVLTLPDSWLVTDDPASTQVSLMVQLRRLGRVVATQAGGQLLLPPDEVVVPPAPTPGAFNRDFNTDFA
jgi:hypothetical protein